MGAAPRKNHLRNEGEAGAALLRFLDAQVAALVEQHLRERGDGTGDPLIRSDRLGPNNRIVLGLIRRGEIRGVLLGKRWHVRRSEWARYVAKLEAEQSTRSGAGEGAPADGTSAERDAHAATDRVLAELGLERR